MSLKIRINVFILVLALIIWDKFKNIFISNFLVIENNWKKNYLKYFNAIFLHDNLNLYGFSLFGREHTHFKHVKEGFSTFRRNKIPKYK